MSLWPWLERALARAGGERATSLPPDESKPPLRPQILPAPFRGPLKAIPSGRREAIAAYGNPAGRNGELDRDWERRSMVLVRDLPGVPKLYVHRLVAPYLREALRRCREIGVLPSIRRIGCFNFRHQRHNPLLPLSYHASGAAADLNAEDNRARYFDGEPPECWSARWRDIWPLGLGQDLVWCFESVGFEWGGRWRARGHDGRAFVDPMHLQLVR